MKLSEALDAAGAAAAANWKRPEYRAGFLATVAVSGLLAPTRVRLVPALLTAVLAGAAVEQLYVVVADVHKAALTAKDRPILAGEHCRWCEESNEDDAELCEGIRAAPSAN